MATSLRMLRSLNRTIVKKQPLRFLKRTLLSNAYNCTEEWNKSIENPSFGEVLVSEFAVQIHEQLEKSGRVSAVDINILTHSLNQMSDETEAEFVEDILKRYNGCQDSFPPCESTSHAIVRGYISAGLAARLPSLLSDRLTYGIFPNFYTVNLAMDHFIKGSDFHNAVTLAYLSTMQEDFSHPLNTLLSLQACAQFLDSVNLDDLAPAPKEESDGEEDWIKVDYIPYPYYDDHFDIKDKRFLLGKTLIMLSDANSVTIPDNICLSMKLIGTGLYHKFDQGLAVLKDILQSSDKNISSQSLNYFSESLQKVESRDADEPEVEIGFRTKDDEVHKMLPNHEEKETLVSEFESLKEKLMSNGKVVDTDSFKLKEAVNEFVTANVGDYEKSDIEKQNLLFKEWHEDLEAKLEKQLHELRVEERVEEMKRQIQELQEEEELLNYFDNEEKVRLTFLKEDESQSDPRLTLTRI